MDIFEGIWNWLCELVTGALEGVVSWLPDSPFKLLSNTPIKPYLAYINWVVPVDFIINTLSLWLAAVAVYYIYSVILRWIKAID